jgi:hypothetical protein
MQSAALNASSHAIDISTLEIVGSDQYTYSFRHDDALVELARIHHVVVHATVPVSYDLIPHSGSFRMVNDVHSELSTFSFGTCSPIVLQVFFKCSSSVLIWFQLI